MFSTINDVYEEDVFTNRRTDPLEVWFSGITLTVSLVLQDQLPTNRKVATATYAVVCTFMIPNNM